MTEKPKCPLCGHLGHQVSKATVMGLLREGEGSPLGRSYWLCLTSNCPAAYYSRGEELWKQEQIRIPIAFKDGAKPKYICYCSQVTEQDIINAVLYKKAVTLSEAIQVTGAMKNGNCITNNPAGICCSSVFTDTYNRAVKLLEQNK